VKKLILASALFGTALFAAEMKGVISDAGCGAKHLDASEKSAKCVEACVKNKGAAPVFITEDGKVLKIADKEKVMAHLGHKVTITGKVDGDTVAIDSVKMD
jgi:hypothetical protein